jgi:SnoaL-like domain
MRSYCPLTSQSEGESHGRNWVQDEIRKLLDEMMEAQNSGDALRLRTMLSERPDAVHIGTDAGEWWTSGQLADDMAAVGGGTTSGRSPMISTFMSRAISPGPRGTGVSCARTAPNGRYG